jgi:hypothetical protein
MDGTCRVGGAADAIGTTIAIPSTTAADQARRTLVICFLRRMAVMSG